MQLLLRALDCKARRSTPQLATSSSIPEVLSLQTSQFVHHNCRLNSRSAPQRMVSAQRAPCFRIFSAQPGASNSMSPRSIMYEHIQGQGLVKYHEPSCHRSGRRESPQRENGWIVSKMISPPLRALLIAGRTADHALHRRSAGNSIWKSV